jgi:hypothetical protein
MKKDQKEGDDMVVLEISDSGTASKEILKKNYHVNFFKLEMYSNCSRDLMLSLQNCRIFPIRCPSRLKNIAAEKCELESFAIRS